MIIGPDSYLGCPKCSEIMRARTLISGNSGGATRWSDGKTAYPMLWAPNPLAICPHCRRFFWRHEGHSYGWKGMMEEEIPNAEAITAKLVPAEEQDYYDALQQGFAGGNPLNERILRISAWWLRNDAWRWPTISLREQRRRKRFPDRLIPTTLTDIQRENLLALAKLLDDQEPQDRLLRLELLREMGEFKAALDYPVAPVSTAQTADAAEITRWCELGDTCVRRLPGIPRG